MQDPLSKLNTQREALEVLTDASRNIIHAQHNLDAATQARDTAIRNAIAAGLTYRDIAEVTGLTQGRIGQIKNHTR